MSHQNLITILIFVALLMFLLGSYIAIRERVISRGRIQSRLQAVKRERIGTETELFDIRQSRSLTPDGYFAISIVSLNKLILQSGTSWGLSGVIVAALACAAAAFLAAYFVGAGLFASISTAIGS